MDTSVSKKTTYNYNNHSLHSHYFSPWMDGLIHIWMVFSLFGWFDWESHMVFYISISSVGIHMIYVGIYMTSDDWWYIYIYGSSCSQYMKSCGIPSRHRSITAPCGPFSPGGGHFSRRPRSRPRHTVPQLPELPWPWVWCNLIGTHWETYTYRYIQYIYIYIYISTYIHYIYLSIFLSNLI